jgi:hypothetical protein
MAAEYAKVPRKFDPPARRVKGERYGKETQSRAGLHPTSLDHSLVI